MTNDGRELSGRRVLLAEDEMLVAMDLEGQLTGLGCEVVGPVSTVAAGLELVDAGAPIDAAVLDVSLKGERVFPLAEALRARDVPFLFLTGYTQVEMPPGLASARRLGKPVREWELAAYLREICGGPAARPAR